MIDSRTAYGIHTADGIGVLPNRASHILRSGVGAEFEAIVARVVQYLLNLYGTPLRPTARGMTRPGCHRTARRVSMRRRPLAKIILRTIREMS